MTSTETSYDKAHRLHLAVVMTSDDIETIISVNEDARLRKYCVRKWGEKGETVLHRAYLRAFEAALRGRFNPSYQTINNSRRSQSAFYNYVAAILPSAYEAEQLGSGWSKKTRKTAMALTSSCSAPEAIHGPITVRTGTGQIRDVILPVICATEKVWEEIEIPSSVVKIDDNGKEHGIQEYADPNTLDPQCSQDNASASSYRDLDAEDISQWFIANLNDYLLHLRDICDFSRLLVLRVMCTKCASLKDVAKEKGLSHQNMTPVVKRICDDLAKRMGIPRDRVQNALDTVKNESALNSQLIIQCEGDLIGAKTSK